MIQTVLDMRLSEQTLQLFALTEIIFLRWDKDDGGAPSYQSHKVRKGNDSLKEKSDTTVLEKEARGLGKQK